MGDEAEMLQYALNLDLRAFFISAVVIAAVAVSLFMLIKKIQDILGIETKPMREYRLLKENVNYLKDEVGNVKEEQGKTRQRMEDQQNEMMQAIQKLSDSIERQEEENIKRTIEDIRWEIIEFANSIRSDRMFDIEAYNFIIEEFDSYEMLIKKKGLENGRVTAAMKLIRDHYEKGMNHGFPI